MNIQGVNLSNWYLTDELSCTHEKVAVKLRNSTPCFGSAIRELITIINRIL